MKASRATPLGFISIALLATGCDASGPDAGGVEAWSPDPDQCFEDQLEAENPERIEVPDGFVMSCRPRWIPEQHCYGVPEAPNDRFPLEWEPWQHRYSYIDGVRQGGMTVLDVELDPKAVLGPGDVCIALFNGTLYSEQNVWEYDSWTSNVGNCSVAVVEQCRCNDAGEPDDPACLDIVVP